MDNPAGIGLYKATGAVPLSEFFEKTDGGVQPVRTLDDFRAVLSRDAASWNEEDLAVADSSFEQGLNGCYDTQKRVEEHRRRSELLALKEEARQVLVRAALVELAMAQQPDLFSEPFHYGFGHEAVLALKRYGAPYKGLFQIADSDGLVASPTDPFFTTIQGQPTHLLHRKRESLKQQGFEILHKIAAMRGGSSTESPASMGIPEKDVRRCWYTISPASPDGDA